MSRIADSTPVLPLKGRTTMSASERTRTRSSLQSAFKAAMARELSQTPGQPSKEAVLRAAAHACRDLLAERWVSTQQQDNHRGVDAPSRRVHYLSMEFLMGRALGNALAGQQVDVRMASGKTVRGTVRPDGSVQVQ
jgi:starch phosphorylase